MFWKIIRWGGSGLMILVLVLAAVLAPENETSDSGEQATVVVPAESTDSPPSKKFY